MPPDLLVPVDCLLKGNGTLGDVERALWDGADPNQQEGKSTPLRNAVQAKHQPLVHLLLQKGADANLKDSKGVGPLHLAAFDGNIQCVQALLDAGADANILDKHGQTPLFFASTAQVCELLIKGRADVNVRNSKHQSPIHLAAHAGFHEVVKLFAEVTDKELLNVQDKNGHTPFYYAARAGVKKTITVLQSKGASMTLHVPPEALEAAKPPPRQVSQAQRRVICEMKLECVDLPSLSSHPSFSTFSRVVKEAVADEASVDPLSVEVEVRGGPRKVWAAISPPTDFSATKLMLKLRSLESVTQALSKRLGDEISSFDGIKEFSRGVAFVSNLHIFVQDSKKITALSMDLPQADKTRLSLEAEKTRLLPEAEKTRPPWEAERTQLLKGAPPPAGAPEARGRKAAPPPAPDGHEEVATPLGSPSKLADLTRTLASPEKSVASEPEEKQDCCYWQVVLEKRSDEDEFGFAQINGKVEFEKHSAGMLQGPEALIVFGIKDDGLLDQWNALHPDRQVLPHDRIISINGQVTIQGMRDAVKSSKITMQIARYPEHFSVTVDRGGRPLGVAYKPLPGANAHELRIVQVAPACVVADHNAEQVSLGRWWLAVLPGMIIRGINGVSGDRDEIMKELKRSDVATLHLQRGERVLANNDKMQTRIRALAAFRFGKGSASSVASSATSPSRDGLGEPQHPQCQPPPAAEGGAGSAAEREGAPAGRPRQEGAPEGAARQDGGTEAQASGGAAPPDRRQPAEAPAKQAAPPDRRQPAEAPAKQAAPLDRRQPAEREEAALTKHQAAPEDRHQPAGAPSKHQAAAPDSPKPAGPSEAATPERQKPREAAGAAAGAQASLRDAGLPQSDAGAVQPSAPASSKAQAERVEGQGPRTWDVTLERPARGEGFGFAHLNGNRALKALLGGLLPAPETLVVESVQRGGLLHAWNAEHPEAAVLPGDRICCINGETTVKGMQQVLNSQKISMKLTRYPERFAVHLHRSKAQPVGMDFWPNTGNETLRIRDITSDGCMHAHNLNQVSSGCWENVVLPNMLVLGVNDVAGDSTLIAKRLLAAEAKFTVIVQRNDFEVVNNENEALRASVQSSGRPTPADRGARHLAVSTAERKRAPVGEALVSPSQSQKSKPPLGLRWLAGSFWSKDASRNLGPATPASSSTMSTTAVTRGSGQGESALEPAARQPMLKRKEERNGCEYWQVLLEKRQEGDEFGFAVISGKLDFQRRSSGAFTGPETLIVYRIKETGLLAAWNRAHPEAEVLPQDRICNVNSEITTDSMQSEIRTSRVLMRVVRYPDRFSVSLDKKGCSLGCRYETIEAARLQEMKIVEVAKDGALHQYNSEQATIGFWQFMVLPEMRIETVNGVTGNTKKMVEALRASKDQVQLIVRRGERGQARQQQVKARVKMLANLGVLHKVGASPSDVSGDSDSLDGLSSSAVPDARTVHEHSLAAISQESRVKADFLGTYVLEERAVVAPTVVPCVEQEVVAELDVGTRVKVLDVSFLSEISRVRVRLEDPPGWMSLLDTDSGFRWAEKQVDEEYSPGVYVLSEKAVVAPTMAPCQPEDIVAELEAGTEVTVTQVVNLSAEIERVRGRLEDPPGWISLMNTATGFRWVEKLVPDDTLSELMKTSIGEAGGTTGLLGETPPTMLISEPPLMDQSSEKQGVKIRSVTFEADPRVKLAAKTRGVMLEHEPQESEQGPKKQESRPQTANSEVRPSSCCLGF